MSSLYRQCWKKILREALPGEPAQQRMAPAFRGDFPEQGEPVKAAVLFLLYPVRDEVHLAFMKRNEYDGPHSGQVSLPGGAWEPEDADLEATSLRETREELGIEQDIEILGALTPLHIPVSNFLVFPFVGWTEPRPDFRPDRSEVQYVIETSLKDLLDPARQETMRLTHHQQAVEAPCYRVGREQIWGATAMMLSEFMDLSDKMRSHRCS